MIKTNSFTLPAKLKAGEDSKNIHFDLLLCIRTGDKRHPVPTLLRISTYISLATGDRLMTIKKQLWQTVSQKNTTSQKNVFAPWLASWPGAFFCSDIGVILSFPLNRRRSYQNLQPSNGHRHWSRRDYSLPDWYLFFSETCNINGRLPTPDSLLDHAALHSVRRCSYGQKWFMGRNGFFNLRTDATEALDSRYLPGFYRLRFGYWQTRESQNGK